MATAWVLRKGRIELGTLRLDRPDFPWLDCSFEPTPAFQEVRGLFEGELALLENPDLDVEAWETRECLLPIDGRYWAWFRS